MGGVTGAPGRLTAFIVSLILVIIGLAVIVYGFTRKEVHVISWGLLVPAYTFFALISGSAIILEGAHTVLGYKGPRGELARIVKIGLWFSIATAVCAWLLIAAETTKPWIFWRIFTDFNVTSRIAWMVLLYAIYAVIVIIQLIVVIRAASGSLEKVELALAFLGIIVAVALYSNLAQVYGTIAAIPAWYGPHLAAYFIVGVVLLGAAGQTLFIMPYAWRDEELKGFLTQFYGRIMILGVLILAFLTVWNVITAWYNPGVWAVYSEIVAGAYSAWFWIIVVLIGIIAVLVLALYATFKRNAPALILAAILTLIAGFVNLSLLIIVSQTKVPEVLGGLYRLAAFHITSWEAIIIVGAIILWPSLYVLGQTLLPLLPGEKPKRLFIFK